MPGRAGLSGRKKAHAPSQPYQRPDGSQLPPLPPKPTEDDILMFAAAVTNALAGGAIDPRLAEALKKLMDTGLAAVKVRHEKSDTRELTELVERAEALEKRALARQSADRLHQDVPDAEE